jgi:CMP-N-acetylneuraminic acid synthetase
MKIVAFVPLKANSQRLKNKNFKTIDNKPLFKYILDELVKASFINQIYLFTNADLSLYELPNNISVINRSIELDQDQVLGLDIYKEFVNTINADWYILCHATSPFTKIGSIEEGLNSVIYEGFDSAFSVAKYQSYTWFNGKPLNFNFEIVPRTQDIQPVYIETSGFYIFSKDLILKYNRRIGYKPYFVEVTDDEAIDIDYEEDFIKAEFYYRLKRSNNI